MAFYIGTGPDADPGNEMRMVAFLSRYAFCCECFAVLRPRQGKVTHIPIRGADLLPPDGGRRTTGQGPHHGSVAFVFQGTLLN